MFITKIKCLFYRFLQHSFLFQLLSNDFNGKWRASKMKGKKKRRRKDRQSKKPKTKNSQKNKTKLHINRLARYMSKSKRKKNPVTLGYVTYMCISWHLRYVYRCKRYVWCDRACVQTATTKKRKKAENFLFALLVEWLL